MSKQGPTPDEPDAPGIPVVPTFTEPKLPAESTGASEEASEDAEKTETITLAHHWTDPKTGLNHLPESDITIDPDTAATLCAAGIANRKATGAAATGTPADTVTAPGDAPR